MASILGIENQIKLPIPVASGVNVYVTLPRAVFDLPDEQAMEVIEHAFKVQHDLSPTEIIEGAVKSLYKGLSVGLAGEAVAGVESAFTDKTFEQSLGEYDAPRKMFEMMYPKTAATIEGVGMAAPVAVSMLSGPQGAAATAAQAAARSGARINPFQQGLALQRQQSMLSPAEAGLARMKNPFDIGATSLAGQTLESGLKGATLAGTYAAGEESGGILDRLQSAQMPGLIGGGISAAAPPVLRGAAQAGSAVADMFRRSKYAPGEELALLAAGKGMQKSAEEMSSAMYGVPKENISQYLSPRYSDMFGGEVSVSPTATVSREGLLGDPILAERVGAKVIDPVTGLPVPEERMRGLLGASSTLADQPAVNRVRTALAQRASEEQGLLGESLRRNVGEADTLLRDKLLELGEIDARLRPVWEEFYNKAYFGETAGAGRVKVPNTVPLSSPKSRSLRTLLDSPEVRRAYEEVKDMRSQDIAAGNWDKVIRGVNQELPSFSDFLSGRRRIPETTWRRNREALEADGWTIAKTKKNDKGKVVSYIIQNKTKSVDVKTLHDIRGIMQDRIKTLETQGRAKKSGGLKDFVTKYDNILSEYSPALKEADSNFRRFKQAESAMKTGEGILGETTLNQLRTAVSDMSPEQLRMYRTSAIEELENSNVSAEQILANQNLRDKISTITGPDGFGDFMVDAYNLAMQSRTGKLIGKEATGAKGAGIVDLVQAKIFNMLAKVSAYKFSMEFAAARDLVELSRKLGKEQAELVGQNLMSILSARTPEEITYNLGRISEAYAKSSPSFSGLTGRLAGAFSKILGARYTDEDTTMRGLFEAASP